MPVSLEQFIEYLTGSGIISADELQSIQESLKPQPQSSEDLSSVLINQNKLTPFQVERISEGKSQGLVLGDYVLLDTIGKGGMGEVYLAEHRHMGRRVALKMLPAAVADDKETLKRFQREIKAAAQLAHPNIVTALDAREDKGVFYFVMEYVEGSNLAEHVREQGPVSVEQAVNCIQQAATGLQYAHNKGIVHRDIKPSNMLLDNEGMVKILDMGLARIDELTGDDPKTNLTATGDVMGTVDYMSPEQAQDTHSADNRSDIYSLGCSLYYLLTGDSIYGGTTVINRIIAHREQPIPSLAKEFAHIPEELDLVYHKMVAKQPADRYQSMTEVLSALQACPLPAESVRSDFRSGLSGFESHQQAEMPTYVPGRNDAVDPAKANTVKSGSFGNTVIGGSSIARKDSESKGNSNSKFWLLGGGTLAAILLAAVIVPQIFQEKTKQSDTTPNEVVTPLTAESTPNFALEFDGKDDIVELPPFPGFPAKSRTIEAYVTLAALAKTGDVLSGGAGMRLVCRNQIGGGDDQLFWMAETYNKDHTYDLFNYERAQVDVDKRTHLAVVWDRTGHELRFYVNGLLMRARNDFRSENLGYAVLNNEQSKILLIGEGSPSDQYGHFFRGTIDELRISNSVRYTKDFTPQKRFEPDEHTMALYHFDEGTGDVLKDSSGNGHHGKIIGAKWVKADETATEIIKPNYALEFDGKSSVVNIPSLMFSKHQEPLTLEGYARFDPEYEKSIAQNDQVLFKFGRIILKSKDLNKIQTVFLDSVTTSGDMPESLSKQFHFTVVLKDGMISQYINGRMRGSAIKVEDSNILNNPKDEWYRLDIGAATGGKSGGFGYFNGQMKEFRVSNTARYTKDFTPQKRFELDEHTIALYHFDEGQGDVLKDSSGNGHHGKIVAAKWVNIDDSTSKKAPKLAKAPFNQKQAKAHQQAWADYLGLPVEKEVTLPGGEKMAFLLIPPGEFLMGLSENEQERQRKSIGITSETISREAPAHPVFISRPFYVSKYEVTQSQWKSVTGKNPSKFSDNLSRPVENVSWNDLKPYLATINEENKDERFLFRLPTEAEWEYAGRAGTKNYHVWDENDDIQYKKWLTLTNEHVWYARNSKGSSQPVGNLKPNPFGLYDMFGNVEEWCADHYAKDYYARSPKIDPYCLDAGTERVTRGSNWIMDHQSLYAAFRYARNADDCFSYLGFRLAMTIDIEKLKASANGSATTNIKPNYALQFDGKSSHVDVPTLKYDGTHALTIELKVISAVNAGDNERHLVWNGLLNSDKNRYQGVMLDQNSGARWRVMAADDIDSDAYGMDIHESDNLIQAGKSVHLAAVLDGQDLRLFVDGKYQATKRGNKVLRKFLPSPDGFVFGGGINGNRAFKGIIDEVRISNIARYDKDFTPQKRFETDEHTLALYHFDEGQGDVLKDSSGNGHHGKIIGAKWVKADGRPLAKPPSSSDYALEFNGDGRVHIPLYYEGKGPLTIEATATIPWADKSFLKNKTETIFILYGKHIELNSHAKAIPGQPNQIAFSGGHASQKDGYKNFFLRANRPIRIAVVVEESKGRVYKDGHYVGDFNIKIKEQALTEWDAIYLGQTLTVPRHMFNGVIDEVRISKTARYKENYKPADRLETDEHTLALYHFDEGQGDVLKDSSGNNHHGKIVGAKWVRVDDKLQGTDSSIFTQPLSDAEAAKHRRAAEWVIEHGGLVNVALEGDTTVEDLIRFVQWAEKQTDTLPSDKFRLWRIYIDGQNKFDDNLLSEMIQVCDEVNSIQNLNFTNTTITDVGLKQLKGIKKLRRIGLHSTPVTDAGMKKLAELKSLSLLGLTDCKITDSGLEHLQDLKNLKSLLLDSTPISDAGLKHLHSLTKLETLNLNKTEVTPKGIADLQKALPKCKIIHESLNNIDPDNNDEK